MPEPLWFETDEPAPLCADDAEPDGWLATLGAPVDDPWTLPPGGDPCTLPPGGDPCTLPPGGVHPPSTDD